MEMIGLLAIAVLLGIPAIAIVALVRSRAAERRVEESFYKISGLQGDMAGLRRELAKLSERVAQLDIPAVAPRAEDQKTGREPVLIAMAVVPVPADEVTAAPVQPSQLNSASPLIDQAPVHRHSEPEAPPLPAPSLRDSGHFAHFDARPFGVALDSLICRGRSAIGATTDSTGHATFAYDSENRPNRKR